MFSGQSRQAWYQNWRRAYKHNKPYFMLYMLYCVFLFSGVVKCPKKVLKFHNLNSPACSDVLGYLALTISGEIAARGQWNAAPVTASRACSEEDGSSPKIIIMINMNSILIICNWNRENVPGSMTRACWSRDKKCHGKVCSSSTMIVDTPGSFSPRRNYVDNLACVLFQAS